MYILLSCLLLRVSSCVTYIKNSKLFIVMLANRYKGLLRFGWFLSLNDVLPKLASFVDIKPNIEK